MESWRKVWREGIVPQLSTLELDWLRLGLMNNDPCLVQGSTTTPPPMSTVLDWPVEATDMLAYGAWKSGGFETVGDCEEFWAKLCLQADLTLGEPGGIRWFLNWYDDMPRESMRAVMMDEVDLALQCAGYKL